MEEKRNQKGASEENPEMGEKDTSLPGLKGQWEEVGLLEPNY